MIAVLLYIHLPNARTSCEKLNDPEREVGGDNHQHDLEGAKIQIRLLEQEQPADEVFLL